MIKFLKILIIMIVNIIVSGIMTYGIGSFLIYPNLDRTASMALYIFYIALVFIIVAIVIGTALFSLFL